MVMHCFRTCKLFQSILDTLNGDAGSRAPGCTLGRSIRQGFAVALAPPHGISCRSSCSPHSSLLYAHPADASHDCMQLTASQLPLH